LLLLLLLLLLLYFVWHRTHSLSTATFVPALPGTLKQLFTPCAFAVQSQASK
jgi:hypothetical protein